jgi:hypothetical protein
LKEEALGRTVWRIRFRKDCGPVVRESDDDDADDCDDDYDDDDNCDDETN